MRRWLAGVTLSAVSLLLALALAEVFLRHARTLESFFDALQYEPELASEGWARAFLRDYARLRKRGGFGNDLGAYVHDPDLGWDTPGHLRGDRRYPLDKPPGVFRVAVVGDSFTWGAEVRDDETYPHRLERRLRQGEVLNLGVRAYGIDQAVLKYLKYGRAYRPDLLVVGIWALDYLRTPLTFYRFAKPLYVLDPATHALVLTRTPIPSPDEVYRTLERELGPFYFTGALVRQVYRLRFARAPDLERYYAKWDPLVEAILARLVEAAQQDGTALLFLLIETGMEFGPDATAFIEPCCERLHLLKIFRRLGVDAIDMGEALPRRYSREIVYTRMYIHHHGVASGHFTPFGNEAVARQIADHVRDRLGVAVTDAD